MPKCQNSNETFLVIFKQCELASIWQVFPNSFLEQQVLSLSVSSEKVNSSHDIFTHDFVFMQFFFKASILFSQMIFFIRKPYKCVLQSHEDTVFENHRKSLIQHCERSELRLHFEWTKVD